jgi:alcohol dehydrogenase (cytochrome c)
LVTASDFVFTGVMNGEFQALDAETGKVLWSFQTPSGIIGHPVTWERNGKQWAAYMRSVAATGRCKTRPRAHRCGRLPWV